MGDNQQEPTGQQQGGQQGQGGTQSGGTGGQQQGGPPAPTFDAWLQGQGDDVRGLITEHTRGLKGALDAEREQRKTFEKQLREAIKNVEAGSDARKKLDELTGQLESHGRQAEFYEQAHAAGVSNLRLAWLAVQQDESLTDKRGNVDMDKLKKAFPELFGTKAAGTSGGGRAPAGNAGSGTGSEPPKHAKMNEFIRQAAGRG